MATIPSLWLYGVIVLVSLTVMNVSGHQAFCGETPPVWRNYNRTCPERAICADVFETTRDWYNGTRCEETRTLHNCMCPGDMVCPYRDPNHLLYASKNHKEYICQPTCTLPWCGNVRTRENSREPVISLTVEQNAEEFGFRTYYRMNCRCPRHHVPYTQGHGVHRSVRAYTHRYDYNRRRFSTLYVCASPVIGREESINDPCN